MRENTTIYSTRLEGFKYKNELFSIQVKKNTIFVQNKSK